MVVAGTGADADARGPSANPYDDASAFSRYFFCWLTPLLSRGRKLGGLHTNDLFKEPVDDSIGAVGPLLEQAWRCELAVRGPYRASVGRALAATFGLQYLVAGICEVVSKCVFTVMVGVTLGFLVSDIKRYLETNRATFGLTQLSPPLPNNNNSITTAQQYQYQDPSSVITRQSVWNSAPANIAYKAVILFILMSSNIMFSQYYLFRSTYIGMKCRLACAYLIFKKALDLSLLTLESTSTKQIMNLLTNDINKFDQSFFYLHYIYIAPLQALIIFALLAAYYVGPLASLAGIIATCLYFVMQVFIGRFFGRLRALSNTFSDERIRLMGELIDSISIIKMYAWEDSVEKNIAEMRQAELDVYRQVITLRAINLSMFYGACKLFLMIILVVHLLIDKTFFDESKIFTAIALTNSMRTNLTLFFPYSVSQVSELNVSLERLREFLLLDDVVGLSSSLPSASLPAIAAATQTSLEDSPAAKIEAEVDAAQVAFTSSTLPAISSAQSLEQNSIRKHQLILPPRSTRFAAAETREPCAQCTKLGNKRALIDKHYAIVFHDVSAGWPESPFDSDYDKQRYSTMMFSNLSAHIKRNEFVMIVGKIGSGKSSLLMSLLNELPIQSGSIRVNGTLSYASQEPWLFAATIRDNITIGWQTKQQQKQQQQAASTPASPASTLNGNTNKQNKKIGRKLLRRLERRYKEVLRICSLDKDLETLPRGDRTVIGERGSTLSGGQRARVNLARALFYDADIYLLDDPLSAVDASVAQHIFDKCFQTFLKHKTVLLVTHQVQFSTQAQKVLLFHSETPQVDYGPASKVLRDIMRQYEVDKPQEASADGQASDSTLENVELGAVVESSRQTADAKSGEKSVSETSDSGLTTRRRSNSADLMASASQIAANNATDTKSQEEKAPADTYWYYTKKGATITTVILFLLANLTTQVFFNGADYFLSISTRSLSTTNLILAYVTIISILLSCSFTRNMLFFNACFRAAQSIHADASRAILKAPMSFFEKNSFGSILSRFSTDLTMLDDQIPLTAIDFIEISTNIAGILIITTIVGVHNIVIAAALIILSNALRIFASNSTASLRKLEGATRGPVYSSVASTLHGLTTIRVFKLESVIGDKFHKAQNNHTRVWFLFLASRHWLTVNIDLLCMAYFALLIIITMIQVFYGSISANWVGLLVVQTIILPGPLQWGARQLAELQSQMSSVTRIKEYATINDDGRDALASTAPANWPSAGAISFEHMSLSYDTKDEPVLRDITFEVRAGEKIGIVGRTGAGKSSMISALFRLQEFEGRILIDNIDVSTIKLADLRRAISIIPQEPVLFSGSVRKNLDPFNEHSDDDIWRALESVRLKRVLQAMKVGLDGSVAEGGQNFSLGQRQLICLARAILRRNKILVLDEATASVDAETDRFIQETIRTLFKDCTVLTIAHRLNTIMDSDRVLVLNDGQVIQFDEPHTLLNNQEGLFASMTASTGHHATILKRIALDAYEKRRKTTTTVMPAIQKVA